MLLKRFFEKRGSYINPETSDLINPADWLISALDTTTMTPNTALKNSNVFTCVNILANDIGKLPIFTFKGPGGKESGMRHPVAKLLYARPNPLMTPFTFKQTLECHAGIYGNGYAIIDWGADGYPKALWPLDPVTTRCELDTMTGQLWYYTQNAEGKSFKLDPTQVLHFKALSRDGLIGIPPWKTLVDELDSQSATKKFISGFYKNGALASGVLETDSKVNGDAKDILRSEFAKRNAGESNYGKVLVLDMGLKYKQLGMQLDQAQFLETQKFGINEVAKVYMIPPHKLAQLDRATYANAEAMGLDYIKTTLLPIFTQWEQELNYKLFTATERKKYYVKFNAAAELRGDSTARANYYQQMINTGVYTINEVRQMEEQTGIGDNGDKHFVSLNYTTLDMLEQLQMSKANSNTAKGGDNSAKGNTDNDNDD